MKNFGLLYKEQITKDLNKEFAYKNIMEIPKIIKIVINMGVGKYAVLNSKEIDEAVSDLTNISGQKPIKTKSKQSISNFKLREGMTIGCKVTLRKQRMYDFLERLVIIALPRVRDFRGFSIKSFDGKGNITLGFKEQIIFSEISYDKVSRIRGGDITIVTSAKTNKEAISLLKGFYIPFKDA